MVKRVEGYFRPAALDQVLFNNYQNDKRPHISTLFHKGVYHALLARSVANINPVYAGFYGFLRGALDIPLAKAQEILFDEFENDMDGIRQESALKAIYVAFNFFATVTLLYTTCKFGELVYWGGKSLVGRADYRPFGIMDLLKIEGMFMLFNVVIELGFKSVGHLISQSSHSSSYREDSYDPEWQ